MTINGFEPSLTRFVLAQGTHQATKANFVLLAKKIVIGIGPLIVIKSLFIMGYNVPSALVLNPLN